ncbi:MAG: hypothetical protein AVDCRST_MAG68-1517 [uncultured Gemmatimonadetes bacterium]|uniref:Uncharacterized protein n=1 Tax=uncultured Gemmatimonadota bacterium TaxID=203437 RepID=A0A6J4KT82_9BACT|nr:MAG: hypothetical protein AVDCRST_MAG68-1517 [uncultured Gemmatimonadota bacterium]
MATMTRRSRLDPLAPEARDDAAALVREVQDLIHRAVAPPGPANAEEMWKALPRFAALVREIADEEDLSDEEVLVLMDAYVSQVLATNISEWLPDMLGGERKRASHYGCTERWLGI